MVFNATFNNILEHIQVALYTSVWIKMKNKNDYTIGTILKSNIKNIERDKINIPNT
jgi:hypothetical protein